MPKILTRVGAKQLINTAMKKTITDAETTLDIAALSKHRQLFLLNPFTKKLLPQHNITHWEQLTCAGYNPYYQRLEAVVNIKQPARSAASAQLLHFFIY